MSLRGLLVLKELGFNQSTVYEIVLTFLFEGVKGCQGDLGVCTGAVGVKEEDYCACLCV